MKKKILVTGGDGRFAKVLKEKNKILDLKFLSKKELDILNLDSIEKCFIKFKPKIIFHCAGLSRPMEIHNENIAKSIDLNIIGTANIVKACKKKI
jgi:dTDP-4-dehydrorhamnose reductase